jgi:hypothetical protein
MNDVLAVERYVSVGLIIEAEKAFILRENREPELVHIGESVSRKLFYNPRNPARFNSMRVIVDCPDPWMVWVE